jgi:hypothetical protein
MAMRSLPSSIGEPDVSWRGFGLRLNRWILRRLIVLVEPVRIDRHCQFRNRRSYFQHLARLVGWRRSTGAASRRPFQCGVRSVNLFDMLQFV